MFKLPLEEVSQLGLWAWRNRLSLKRVPADPEEFVQSVLSKGFNVLRFGSSLMLGSADADPEPLAFLGESTSEISEIEQSISRMDGVPRLVAGAVASLGGTSMVTLGLTAITPIILAAQFSYLRKRFDALQKDIRHLQRLLEDRYVAELESGLELLESGVRQSKKARIESALEKCNDAAVFFSNRVQNAVQDVQDRRGIQLLSRHLSVAICGTTRCYVALEEDAEARKALGTRCPALREATKAIFQKTVGRNPERFLDPDLSRNVTLDDLVGLYQQAMHAEILDSDDRMQKAISKGASASELFDVMRGQVVSRKWLWSKPNAAALKEELRDATASLEEMNRVLSLASVLEQAKNSDKKAIETVEWFDEEAKSSESQYFAWGF